MKLYQQKWLEKLDYYIEENTNNSNFSTSQLAFLMDISLTTLHRKLEQLHSRTPAEYIKEKQLQFVA